VLGSEPLGTVPLGGSPTSYVPDYYEDISIFLPFEIREPIEASYLQLHTKAFTDNQNANNDYALLALHHIFMFTAYGLLYSCLRRDHLIAQSVFAIAPVRDVEDRRQLQGISSLFTLSLVKERTFFDLMFVVGCDTSADMKKLKQLVDDRNDLAHCNGKRSSDFEKEVTRYLDGFEILHSKFAAVVTNHLTDLNNIDFVVPPDGQIDQLRTILSTNCISQRMLELATPAIGKGGLTKKSKSLLLKYLAS
jgi:hypothetical protein